MQHGKAYLKIRTAAQLYDVHPNTVEKWLKAAGDEIRVRRPLGGDRLIDARSLEKWIDSGAGDPVQAELDRILGAA